MAEAYETNVDEALDKVQWDFCWLMGFAYMLIPLILCTSQISPSMFPTCWMYRP
jgi:hypothetical protein